ncbi:MAG: hypothetical protein LBQ60_19250, partial [Bacteroidales bacterium]|nr:hypothetical protein [Bacteroidales bacterium]
MRKIDKEAKRDYRSKEEKKADAEREKKEKVRKKEEEKTYSEALKQHRSLQSEEMLRKMDYDLSVSNKKYGKKKEFFLVRWFKPKDDIEKIEKR